MTILSKVISKVISKVKTLIEYAKFGMGVSAMWRGKAVDELFIAKGINSIGFGNGFGKGAMRDYAKAINMPYVTYMTGSKTLQTNEVVEKVTAPKVTVFERNDYFYHAYGLKELYLDSCIKASDYLFCNCKNLQILKLGALNESTNTAFMGCGALHTLIVGEGTAANLFIQYSSLLTQECMHNIIDNVADRIGTSALTLYVHQDVYDRISEEYKTKLSQKNWNLAVKS